MDPAADQRVSSLAMDAVREINHYFKACPETVCKYLLTHWKKQITYMDEGMLTVFVTKVLDQAVSSGYLAKDGCGKYWVNGLIITPERESPCPSPTFAVEWTPEAYFLSPRSPNPDAWLSRLPPSHPKQPRRRSAYLTLSSMCQYLPNNSPVLQKKVRKLEEKRVLKQLMARMLRAKSSEECEDILLRRVNQVWN